MPLLSRAEILGARDKKTIEVPTPEWGEDSKVLVGTMGVLVYAEITDWMNALQPATVASEPAEAEVESDEVPNDFCCDSAPAEVKAEPEAQANDEPAEGATLTIAQFIELKLRWCAACLLDPKAFQTMFTVDDVRALGAKDPAPIDRIFKAAQELHHDTAESDEAFEKNLDGTPVGASGNG